MKRIKRKKLNKMRSTDVSDKRINFLKVISFIFFGIILGRIFYLNVFYKDYYTMILNNKTKIIVEQEDAPRGRILDRNGKVLVDNKEVRKIYYLKDKNITTKEEIEMCYKLKDILDLPYDNLLTRNLKEFYIIVYEEEANKKITSEEYEDLKNRKLTENEVYELKIERITKEDLSVFNLDDKKSAYIYYLMNKGYSTDMKTIKIDATYEEYAYISERIEEFKGFNTKLDWERTYPYENTIRSILGSVSDSETGIPKEKASYYLSQGYELDDRVGISGLEEYYDKYLRGEKAKYQIMEDGSLEKISDAKAGNDIVLSIDIDLQIQIEDMMKEEVVKAKSEPHTKFYNRSFVVIQNPKTGEIYSMAGVQTFKEKGKYVTYDYSIGPIVSTITPGSVVKGASIIVGYNTGVIDIGTTMLDSCIKFLNMPEKCSWKSLGYINDLDALKWSSNIYQFKIAMMVGGQSYKYNSMLDLDLSAFDTYRKTFYQFGLGVKTGIDYPIEETGVKGKSIASDLLINYAIGQYDTYTTLQLSQYISTIANDGSRVKPRFLKSVIDSNTNEVIYESPTIVLNKVETEEKYLKRVQKGFRLCITGGTCVDYMGSALKGAGKTGTSESFVDDGSGIYDHPTMSNNFVGYAPYDDPVMSIAVSSPDVLDMETGTYRTDVNYRISKKASNIFFSLYDSKGNRK